ncbi:unnamed protein product, partial [Polarella glacialis]
AAILGGRCASQPSSLALSRDCGGRLVTVSDPRFEMLVKSPLLAGLLQEWPGRFGVLGAVSGAVLPRDAVLETGMFRPRPPPQSDQDQAEPDLAEEKLASPMNYCGFLEGPTGQKLFAKASACSSLSESLLQSAGVEVLLGLEVCKLDYQHQHQQQQQQEQQQQAVEEGSSQWSLSTSNQQISQSNFDCLVLANHDPIFAAGVIEQLQASNRDPEMRRPEVSEVISGFAAQLRTLAAEQQSRYSLTVSFPRPLRGLAFDAAS